tara:strand:- start:141750 stop:141917 length:168 start_codon:yes stop_codon:yes gene_type:complete
MAENIENKDQEIETTALPVMSKNRKNRNYMILALIFGLVAIIWVVTMLKTTQGMN